MDKAGPLVLSIVSTRSGTGKTTLIEALICIFKNKGYRVGALKNDAHRLEIDKKGKDSCRFTEAGADTVVISSSSKLVMIKSVEEKTAVEDIIRLFEDMDFVIIEGFKESGFPKIEVHRKEVDGKLLCTSSGFNKSSFIAVASDEPLDVDLDLLDLNDPVSVAEFIESNKSLLSLASFININKPGDL